VDPAAVDALLTGVACQRPHADVARAVHHYLDRLDEDGPEPDPTEGRRLVLARHADGSLSGRFELDPVGGEQLQTALEALLQAGRCAGDERTRSQQRVERQPDGRWRTWRPDGTEILTGPLRTGPPLATAA
jgi:hypothetical protein